MVWQDPPFIYLYHPVETLAMSKKLKGFQPRPDEFYFFQNASLEN